MGAYGKIGTLCLAAFALLAGAGAGWGQDTVVISSPEDGDVFEVGQTITVRFDGSAGQDNGNLRLKIGRRTRSLDTDAGETFVAAEVGAVTCEIPAYFIEKSWDDAAGAFVYDSISTVAQACRIEYIEYGGSTVLAASGTFSIVPAAQEDEGGCGKGGGLALIPPLAIRIRRMTRKRRRGKRVSAG